MSYLLHLEKEKVNVYFYQAVFYENLVMKLSVTRLSMIKLSVM